MNNDFISADDAGEMEQILNDFSDSIDSEFACTYFVNAEAGELCSLPPVMFADGYVTCEAGHTVKLERR